MLDPDLGSNGAPSPHTRFEVASGHNGGFSFSTVDLQRQAELHKERPYLCAMSDRVCVE